MSDEITLRDTLASGPHTDSASDRSGNPPRQVFLQKNLTLTGAERAFLRRLQPSENAVGSYWTVISPEDRKLVFGLLARLGGDK